MTTKTMSAATEDTSAQHKRNASATSAVQTSPPPAKKRPEPAPLAGRRDFPHAVAMVLYKDGGEDDAASTTTVVGVYASLADANDEVRRMAREHGAAAAKTDDASSSSSSSSSSVPARWEAPDGASCWVELHAVKPKTIVRRDVSSSSEPPKKLYDAEEGEDPDLDDDDQEEGGHYD